MEEELVSMMFDSLDLTRYEAMAFLTLVKLGPLTITKLSEVSGVPRPKCYSVLKSLVFKGMASYVMSKPIRGQALLPELAFQNRLTQLVEELNRKREYSDRVLRGIKTLSTRDERDEGRKYNIYLIEKPKNIVASIAFDLDGVENEILVAISMSPVRFDWRRILNVFEKLKARNLTFRYLAPTRGFFDIWAKGEYIKDFLKKAGIKVRFNTKVHQPFAVFDERLTYIFFTDPVLRELSFALKIEDERFARHMKTYFEFLWERGDSST
ncbi:MAG: hypothetical protein GTN80_06340 [Nitrososphaeria archaeon]|nr:hypothetical protein [Nitrososphaeria archaeon]NIQ33245.1 hypothetical protein [Nitrososphaeria archaeon]